MTDLTECEIFDCLSENFRLAAECCEKLAVSPKTGPIYRKLREQLRLCDGACRQAAYWRGDARWLYIGRDCIEAWHRSGKWLREYRGPEGRRVAHPLFLKLAEVLRAGAKNAERLRTAATYKIGPIVPEPLPGPHRDTRPVSMGGLILPAGFVDKRQTVH